MIELFDNNEACKIAGEASGEMHRIYGLGAKTIPLDDTMDFTFTFGTMDGLKEAIDSYYTEGHNGFVLKYPYRGESKYAVLLSLTEPTIAYKRPFEMKMKVRVTSPDFTCDYMTLDENGEYEYMGLYSELGYTPTNVFVPPVIFNDTMQPIMTNQLESTDEAFLFGGNFLDLTSDTITVPNPTNGSVLYYDMDTKSYWGGGGDGDYVDISGYKVNTIVVFDVETTSIHKDQMNENPQLIYDVFFNGVSIVDSNADITITKDNILHFYPCQENAGELIYDLVNPPLAMDFSVDIVEDVTLPLVSGYTFLFEVDWGDGTIENYIGDGSTPPTHSYATVGVKRITIKGQCEYIKFYATPLQDKLVEVHSLGDTRLLSLKYSFMRVTNIAPSNFSGDTSQITSMKGLFAHNMITEPHNIVSFKTHNVTDMSVMFYNNANTTTPYSVSHFVTSKVVKMNSMFDNNVSLLTPPLVGAWHTPALTDTNYMFYNNVSLTSVPNFSNWDVRKLTTCQSMMQNVPSLLDDMGIENWQIESLTDVTDFAKGSGGFSTAKYDEILIAWESRPHQSNVPIHFGETTKYTAGGDAETARDALIADGWVITDGGIA